MSDFDDAINAHVDSDVRQAVRALANAAAVARIAHHAAEHELWFLVRALCNEHHMDVAGVMTRAEHVAAERVQRAQQL